MPIHRWKLLPEASLAAAAEALRAVLLGDLAAPGQVHQGVPRAEIFEAHLAEKMRRDSGGRERGGEVRGEFITWIPG